MFPEIFDRLKQILPESEPISLNLKNVTGTFSTADINWYRQNGYPQMYAALSGGGPSWSGESVTRENALQHPVVFACNRVVSEPLGFLPAKVMQVKGGEHREATELPVYDVMKHEPNSDMTSQEFREMLTSHELLQGNAYALIQRRSGTGVAVGMVPIPPESVMPDREKAGQKRLVYVIKEDRSPNRTYTVQAGKPHDILHIRGLGWDGMRGYSVIDIGRQGIGTAIAAERNAARFWAMGGRPPYHLELDRPWITPEEGQLFRRDWEETYREPQRAPILPRGIKYETDGLTMKDAQALEFSQAMISAIARWFNVSPHLVGDLSRATFSNIEHLALEFVKMTLAAHISRWEEAFRRCVLTAEEKAQGYFLKFNLNALLRGDFMTRMAGYGSALQNGHLNVDEVRELEDRNKLPDGAGQDYHIQLNLQALPSQDPAQQNGLVKLGAKPKETTQ